MRLLIDLDNILFRCLLATKDKNYYYQVRACESTLERIVDKFGYEYELIVQGLGNFRKILDPNYKAHRKNSERPRYLYDAKNYFLKYYNPIQAEGCETDDIIGTLHGDDTIAVVNDHDYLQLGGKFYNPWKDQYYEIDNPDFYFWRQMLTGCKSDNVPGCLNPEKLHHSKPPCFTDDTAGKLLEGSLDMKEIVQDQYKLVYGDEWYARYDLTARLLFLRRSNAREYYEKY
jgi:hypothetical protein